MESCSGLRNLSNYIKWLAILFALVYGLYVVLIKVPVEEQIYDPHQYKGILKRLMPSSIANFSSSFAQPLNPPVVLAWTTFFAGNLLEGDLLNQYKPDECPYKCIFSDDTNLYANNASVFLFHPRDLDQNKLPPANPNALKAFLLVESPVHSGETYKNMPADYFNLTVTYRTDSDIFLPYDFFEKIEYQTKTEEFWQENEILEKLKKKTNLALQFVSNCDTSSKREKYVDELKKLMAITEYGTCNNNSCPGKECLEEKIDTHLFYLAFENSVCKQYVTEKFWNIKRLIVPVVLNRQVLEGLDIPDSAYIAANDFAGPRELAARLKYLQTHHTKYLKHFEWTKSYKKTAAYVNPLCKLCQFAMEKRKMSVPNIVDFWEKEGECQKEYVPTLLG